MINVLSLFDGLSCGQIALNRLGVDVGTYYASELDKHAIKVSSYNYPGTVHLGDVRNVTTVETQIIEAPSLVRRLTPVEACRLQTIPDAYFFDTEGKKLVSDTAIYRMVGNGWTVDVIVWILSFANLPMKSL